VTFAQFEEHEALTRAAIASAANTGHPVHGSARGARPSARRWRTSSPSFPPDDGDRLVATCLAIYSAPFWQMLRDRGQLSAAEAREAGVAAMDAVLTVARARLASVPNP
jgi:hypothetical protein